MVKDLVESEFQQQYNVPISINLVVGGVVEATLADKGPDVALFLGGEFPVTIYFCGMMKGRIFFRKEKNLQFLFQNVSKKEEKTETKMEEET